MLKLVFLKHFGNSQAVRLPNEFRFDAEQVGIFRQGNGIVLRERSTSAAAIFDALARLPADFMEAGRSDTPPEEREAWSVPGSRYRI